MQEIAVRTVIGWRKDGRPIYLMQGAEDGGQAVGSGAGGAAGGAQGAQGAGAGAGQGTGAGGAGAGGAGQPAGQAGAGAGDQAGGAGGQQQQTPAPVALDPIAVDQLKALGWLPPGQAPATPARNHTFAGDGGQNLPDLDYQSALREVANLRKENGRDRTQAQNQIHNLYARAIGVEEATPDAIVARLAALSDADTRASNAALRLAVYQRASIIGANADRLLDSQAFLSGLAGLDPTGSDALDAKIREAAEKDPVYRAPQYRPAGQQAPAGTAVTPSFQGSTTVPNGKPATLTSAIEAAMAKAAQ